ncbi:glycerol-3-phosphate 1-O-acyltransferase PlsY [Phaeobacter sp. 22II1-1F12B]|uniref:glycerol-3-phosphate 1-O-acyltransferase PlsY n=1 Tax=Phaeobacter sp. 22II1-1F12B TaxID=1317111 RepID=UPI000B523701|nr:glycerol-3-phosphate 1-O-acyltransferase PlsY [Phaeobacter sp. 22II1-1F12B]OWU79082.1 glycerol-3-phosphate acyltransferase [Phaeobacter sp. 22II1-1F12B]
MPVLETAPLLLLLCAVMGYLLGSIASGMILARVMNLGDLRSIGSGNIGATNVLRTGNKLAAALTLLFDGAKGAVAVLIARKIGGEDAAQIAGLAAFIGHCYPVWLGFKGGKGVATFLGLWLALAWPVGLACCVVWLLTALITRISSLSALVAAASALIWAIVFDRAETVLLGALVVVLVFWRHRSNIARLMNGTEPRIGSK